MPCGAARKRREGSRRFPLCRLLVAHAGKERLLAAAAAAGAPRRAGFAATTGFLLVRRATASPLLLAATGHSSRSRRRRFAGTTFRRFVLFSCRLHVVSYFPGLISSHMERPPSWKKDANSTPRFSFRWKQRKNLAASQKLRTAEPARRGELHGPESQFSGERQNPSAEHFPPSHARNRVPVCPESNHCHGVLAAPIAVMVTQVWTGLLRHWHELTTDNTVENSRFGPCAIAPPNWIPVGISIRIDLVSDEKLHESVPSADREARSCRDEC